MQSKYLQYISIVCVVLGIAILVWTFYPQKINKSPASDQTIKESSRSAQTGLDPRYNTLLKIDDQTLFVEIADTAEKRMQGLSGRTELPLGAGMVFTFDPPQKVSFWMPDMHFSIDILYIKDNQVVEIFDSVPYFPKDTPSSDLPRYRSREEIDLVLEVPAGYSQENNITVGTPVSFPDQSREMIQPEN